MEFRQFTVAGPVEIRPAKIVDERGYFSEIFRADKFAQISDPSVFVQENQSLSVRAGTIRGLHFQIEPAAQGKLIRCIQGRLFDVAVDLRSGSPTFGHSISIILSPEENNQLWVPLGFAHGFCTLEPNSITSYRVTSFYSREHDKGVAWDDPAFGIEWPEIADPDTLSAKDRVQPSLSELPAYFEWHVG